MSGKKLLVADDSLTIQKVIRLALSHEGYDIQAVSDGVEAVEQLLLFRPQVVLIDVSLPGKSATEVKAIADSKPELQDIRFVLMSSAFEQVDESLIQGAHFHGRLTKPFDPAHLRKVLVDCLEPASPGTPPIAPVETPPDFPPLWNQDQSSSAGSPPSLAPPPFESKPVATTQIPEGEADIRQLTQSTLKMAGFDDFDWSVNEGAKKQPIEMSPAQSPAPASFASFDHEPSLPPLPKMTLGDPPSQAPSPVMIETPESVPTFESMPHLEIPVHQEMISPSTMSSLDEARIEAMVQERVEAALERISKDLLPQIAERVIKQEIHRLLAEGP